MNQDTHRCPRDGFVRIAQRANMMKPLRLRLLCTGLVALSALASVAFAQAPPATSTEEQLPPHVTAVDGVLLPVASEVFITLDKFANSNWRAVQRPELARWRPHGNQASVAMLLGAVIAEGFVAVEAKDAPEVQNLGRAVLTLARGLGVEQSALKRSRSIMDAAESEDWDAVRKEWNNILPDVQQGMNALRSEQLAHLVSLGGWARGTEALSALLLQNYSAEEARLLWQRTVLAHFDRELVAISGELRAPLLPATREKLQQYRAILDAAPGVSPEAVKEIARLSGEFLGSLNGEVRRTERPAAKPR